MSNKTKNFDFGDMVLWLRNDFTNKGYNVSNTYEEYPTLPIDLFCTKGKGKTQQCCLVIVASIKHISEEFQKKLLFYQYYLSLHYKPSQYQIVLAVPAMSTIVTIPYYAEDEEEKKKNFYNENGFGLWKIKGKNIIDKEINPITLSDKIANDFKNAIAKENKTLTKIATKVPSFVDKYIHDSLLGIAQVNPIKFEERYIDAGLLYEALKLKKISYRKHLFNAISEHLSYKDSEYDFVRNVFSKLWEEWIGISYIDFLETFDPALQHVFAETSEEGRVVYRDHYIHQFQVFLTGLYILDRIYDELAKHYKKPEICWLIASSFHDMAYPVQLYDEWSDEFFKKVFNVEQLGHVELKSHFVQKSFLICMSSLITRFCSVILQEEVSGDWYAEKNSLVQCFYKEITELKNHCILSSISLLKITKEKYADQINITGLTSEDAIKSVFIPSALSIALHDDRVWKKLKDNKEWEEGRCPLPVLNFQVDPFSFLLIFCDNIQEWGRPSLSKAAEKKEERWKRFYLKNLEYIPAKGFDFTLYTPNHKRSEKFFIDKENEFRELQVFLKQPPNVEFTVHLEDQVGDGVKEGFRMLGVPV